MNRSIDLLEEMAHETGNIFNLNRRGYVYATADESRLESFIESAHKPVTASAGGVKNTRCEASRAERRVFRRAVEGGGIRPSSRRRV